MNALSASAHGVSAFRAGFSGPAFQSVMLHLVVLAAGLIGLPHVTKEPYYIPPPVAVDIVQIDEITQSNNASQARPNKAQAIEKPAPPQAKPAPPKVVSKAPPKIQEPAPPEIDDNVAQPRESESVPDLERQEIKKPDPPKKKEPEATTQKPAPPKEDRFQSLLKNLTPDASEEREDSQNNDMQLTQKEEEAPPAPRLAERVTISEEDALRRQLAGCWNVLSGAKYAEDLAVEVQVIVNPDRTVQNARIVDNGRYKRDPHFRAAADAAMRALRNPRCIPLDLPADKYESWRTTIIRFDPKDML